MRTTWAFLPLSTTWPVSTILLKGLFSWQRKGWKLWEVKNGSRKPSSLYTTWISCQLDSRETDSTKMICKKWLSSWWKLPIFQALRYWKILFSPADFEPTSVRNCQFLTPPVRNCQHAVPEQVLGLEQSEQQCVLDTRRHLPTPTRYWGTEQPTRRFFKYKLFSLHQVCRRPCL